MIVQLVLAAGSRAGTVANIYRGYYMIGRHRECQIRPKSRSVSRHHCLIFHGPDGCSVFDLGSTSGTRVNDERIEPRQWVELHDGDQLRCGKVAFSVVVSASEGTHAEPVGAATGERQQSMVRGAAWQESDIASFLESEDDAARQRRYQSIRGHASTAEAAGPDDLDVFDDTPLESDEATSAELPTANDDSEATARTVHDADSDDDPGPLSGIRGPAGKPSADGVPRRLGAKPRAAKQSLDTERLKLFAVIVVTVVAVGFLLYTLYEFQAGPDIRVLDELD